MSKDATTKRHKGGRPRIGPQIWCRVTPEQSDQITDLVLATGKSRSEVIRNLIAAGLLGNDSDQPDKQ